MAQHDPYVLRKIAHMQRNGISAGIGLNGGAAPQSLIDVQKENRERKRQARRKAKQAELSGARADIDWD